MDKLKNYLKNSLHTFNKIQGKIYLYILLTCLPLNALIFLTQEDSDIGIIVGGFLAGILGKILYLNLINFLVYRHINSNTQNSRNNSENILSQYRENWLNIMKTIAFTIFGNIKLLPFLYPPMFIKNIYSYEAIEEAKLLSKKFKNSFSYIIALIYYIIYISTGIFRLYLPLNLAFILSLLSDIFLAYVTIFVTSIYLDTEN